MHPSVSWYTHGDMHTHAQVLTPRLPGTRDSSLQVVMTSGLYHFGLVQRVEVLRLRPLSHSALPCTGGSGTIK